MIAEFLRFEVGELSFWTEALACSGQRDIRRARAHGTPLPRLYDGTIRYQREPAGQERWRSARHVAAAGIGDCEDLAAYRVAELRELEGERGARVKLLRRGPHLIHAVVERANGQIEDPSRKLGMKTR